jgi:chemotaxis protein MotB
MADKKDKATIIIKKIQPAAHGGHGGAWKVAYADFVTAMMAFFLVMWLMGTDEETKAAVEGYFKSAGSPSALSISPTDPKGGDKIDEFQERSPSGGRPIDLPAGKTNTQADEEKELQNLKEVLEETISLELGVANHSDQLEMVYDSKGLVLRIAIKNFFDHGSSEVKPDLIPILYRVGKVISKTHRLIRIEGHNDPTELTSGGGPDWQLSTARAGWVAQFWMKSFPGLAPSHVQVAGNAHFRPLSGDRSPASLAADRRVEIIVLNDQYK